MRYAIALMGIATMAAAAPMNMHMRKTSPLHVWQPLTFLSIGTNMESDAMMMDAANEHGK
jgi:hypothetical protein